MDSSKRIIIFISLWLILSCVLLGNSQGFEVQLSRTGRSRKHKPRKTQENHQQYVKQMADLFSRLVVCMKGKNAFLFVCLSVCLFSRLVIKRVSMGLTHRHKTAKNLVDSRKN